MVHRVTFGRNTNATEDALGHLQPETNADWLPDTPCLAVEIRVTRLLDDTKETELRVLRLVVMSGLDLDSHDVVKQVQNQTGSDLFFAPGEYPILSVLRQGAVTEVDIAPWE